MFFQVTKRWDVIKMRDNVIPRGNCAREETIHISKSFAPYFLKCTGADPEGRGGGGIGDLSSPQFFGSENYLKCLS